MHLYVLAIYTYNYIIADMSERCIHCGACEGSILQPEYDKWVSGCMITRYIAIRI